MSRIALLILCRTDLCSVLVLFTLSCYSNLSDNDHSLLGLFEHFCTQVYRPNNYYSYNATFLQQVVRPRRYCYILW